jgi:two-component system, NarL family, sensor kinase
MRVFMGANSSNITIVIIAGTLVFLLLSIALIFYVFIFQKRQTFYLDQSEKMRIEFNQQLLQSQLEMQEQTFNTISQEIHDNVGQVLSLAKVQLNIMDQHKTFDESMLNDVKDSVSKAMTDLRDIAKSLNSERIKLSSLPEITALELQRISRAGVMQASIQTDGAEQSMQEQKKLIIFRIIQEALHNILKHSKATNIEVSFSYAADELKIKISDNGTGFDKELLSKKDGLGLKNMINRAALIGGKANIESIINKGTFITLICPYD